MVNFEAAILISMSLCVCVSKGKVGIPLKYI